MKTWKQSSVVIAILLGVCLSGCKLKTIKEEFPDRPSGWSCTLFFDKERTPFYLIEELKKASTDDEILEISKKIKSLRKDRTQFICNDLRNLETEASFHYADPLFQKARVMPLRTAEAYDAYIFKKIKSCKK